ncbi:MAG: transposase [Prevotellaceae bacterium]|nr:transposase [Prevotellaceae bacterium]
MGIITTGAKGRKEIKGVQILTLDKYEKRQKRKKFRSRAGIESVIGHLKTDFRMAQNYLHGVKGIQINVFMSATAWNLKKKMEILAEKPNDFFVQFFSVVFSQKFHSKMPPEF